LKGKENPRKTYFYPAAYRALALVRSGYTSRMALRKVSYPNISVLPSLSKERELVGKDKSGAGETLHNEGAGA
jgi:hypothetical protein